MKSELQKAKKKKQIDRWEHVTGDWVKEQRIKAGMSQTELAEAIGASGKQHIYKIETTGAMSDQTKYKLFDLFCVVK
jgi:DNA-binding XRE family transcriptional regulator